MITEIYKKTFTGKESPEDLNNIVFNYLNPEKIKDLRFVFVIKIPFQKWERKCDCFSRGGNWIRINYYGKERIQTNEQDFKDLIFRTRKTMELPRTCVLTPEYLKLVVYGNNE